MTKQQIYDRVKTILALQISDDIKDVISEQVSDLIFAAIDDEHKAMKKYVDEKLAEL